MPDRFLHEVTAVHALRQEIRTVPTILSEHMMAKLGPYAADDWALQARDAQLPPADLDWCWLLLGGRGTGKTRALSGAVHMAVRAGLKRLHLIAPTTADFHDVNIEGSSGILNSAGRDPRPRWVATRRRLEWPNGAVCVCFSADEPESLRGPQCEACFIDEIGRMRYMQQVFDMGMMGLRLGDRPRMFIATTPRTTPFMKRLVKMDNIRITTGSTYDNAAHLAPGFLTKIKELYEGTRLGRQELQGAMILDPANALFKDDWIIRHDVPEEIIEQVTVGVDPSGGEDEVGIVVSALLRDGRYAVLADRTITGSPGQWGEAAVRAHDEFDADDIVVETNYGGAMAADVVKQAADRMFDQEERPTNLLRVTSVVASRGKAMRAEPVSLLYERGRVLHRHGLNQLEAEMMAFSRDFQRDKDGSPNRLDAMVWGLTRLCRILTEIPIA